MFDVMADWLAVPLLNSEAGNPPKRMALAHPSIAPYGVFQSKDGKGILISIQSEREWKKLCAEVLDQPDLPKDSRFASMVERVRNRALTDKTVGDSFATMTRVDLLKRLADADIAFAEVNTMADLAVHPHLRRIEVDTPNGMVDLCRARRDLCRRAAPLRRGPGIGQTSTAEPPNPSRAGRHHDRDVRRTRHRPWRHVQFGKTTEASDIVTAQLVKGLRATLFQEIGDRSRRCGAVDGPWCLAQPVFRCRNEPGRSPDARGFLPPVPLPRGCGPAANWNFSRPACRRRSEADVADIRCDDEDRQHRRTVLRRRSSPDHDAARHCDPRAATGYRYREMVTGSRHTSQGAAAAARRQSIAKATWPIRSAVPLFGADLQWPSHPLRPRLRRPGSRAIRASCSTADAGGVDRRTRRTTSRRRRAEEVSYRGVQPLFEGNEFSVNANETGAGMDRGPRIREGQRRMKGTGRAVKLRPVIPGRCKHRTRNLNSRCAIAHLRSGANDTIPDDGPTISRRPTPYVVPQAKRSTHHSPSSMPRSTCCAIIRHRRCSAIPVRPSRPFSPTGPTISTTCWACRSLASSAWPTPRAGHPQRRGMSRQPALRAPASACARQHLHLHRNQTPPVDDRGPASRRAASRHCSHSSMPSAPRSFHALRQVPCRTARAEDVRGDRTRLSRRRCSRPAARPSFRADRRLDPSGPTGKAPSCQPRPRTRRQRDEVAGRGALRQQRPALVVGPGIDRAESRRPDGTGGGEDTASVWISRSGRCSFRSGIRNSPAGPDASPGQCRRAARP